MGKYFEAIKPYLQIHPKLLGCFYPSKQVKERGDIMNWQEVRAKEWIYELSAIALLGVLDGLGSKKDTAVRFSKSDEIIRGKRDVKKNIDLLIDARRLSINTLFPSEEVPTNIKKDISLLGIIGLGILRTVFPDAIGEGMLRISVMSLLLRQDFFAALIREEFSNSFNGTDTVEAYILKQRRSGLTKEQLHTFYKILNLENPKE